MPTLTFDPSTDEPSNEQKAAEAAALEQGEALAKANEEDRLRQYEQQESENEDVALIGGKFKSQADLLKAYKELESKLGSNEKEETTAEGGDGPEEEASEEEPPEADDDDTDETVNYMFELNKEFEDKGQLSEEAIDKLSSMDTKDLIKSYMKYQAKASQENTQASLQATEIARIKDSVGGEESYNEMIGWAAENLNQDEISDFNTVTESGNPIAIKFAVDSLHNRYRNSEGFEAPLVTGRKAASGVKPYRSQAELARDISNPLYTTDPAFRQDVEARLERSTDLL